MDTTELCKLLGLTREGLRTVIKRNQLQERLLKLNYELVSVEKVGRSNQYNIREVVMVPKETWEELAAKEFPRVRKVDKLGIHAKERLINRTEITRNEITNKTGVSKQTTERWDGMRVEKGYMRDGGYAYYEIKDRKLNQITYAEYQKYWSNRSKTRALVRTLTETESEHGKELMLENITTALQDSYCIRVRSYLVNEFTEKYQRIVAVL